MTGLSDIEISELFDQFNPSKDGLLDYKEFVSIYSNKSIFSKKKSPKPQIEEQSPIPIHETKEIQKNLNKKEFFGFKSC